VNDRRVGGHRERRTIRRRDALGPSGFGSHAVDAIEALDHVGAGHHGLDLRGQGAVGVVEEGLTVRGHLVPQHRARLRLRHLARELYQHRNNLPVHPLALGQGLQRVEARDVPRLRQRQQHVPGPLRVVQMRLGDARDLQRELRQLVVVALHLGQLVKVLDRVGPAPLRLGQIGQALHHHEIARIDRVLELQRPVQPRAVAPMGLDEGHEAPGKLGLRLLVGLQPYLPLDGLHGHRGLSLLDRHPLDEGPRRGMLRGQSLRHLHQRRETLGGHAHVRAEHHRPAREQAPTRLQRGRRRSRLRQELDHPRVVARRLREP
jgi:hypothetical protein